jgi:hypothetical protein
MGPWNLHERILSEEQEKYFVNAGIPLTFFHFSGFDPASQKLHKDYTRYDVSQRPDLVPLFEEYRAKLIKAGYAEYKTIACYYVDIRNEFLQSQELLRKEKESIQYKQLPFHNKVLRQVKRNIPLGFKRFALKLMKS